MMLRTLTIALLLGLSLGAQAGNVEPREFDSREQEENYQELIEELRCLVCMNQNIADSNAELAQDLRRETYKMVRAGKSKDEITDFMVDRYGDFVMYSPPVKSTTILLWTGPFILMFAGVFIAFRQVRKNAASHGSDELSNEEQERLRSILAEREGEEKK